MMLCEKNVCGLSKGVPQVRHAWQPHWHKLDRSVNTTLTNVLGATRTLSWLRVFCRNTELGTTKVNSLVYSAPPYKLVAAIPRQKSQKHSAHCISCILSPHHTVSKLQIRTSLAFSRRYSNWSSMCIWLTVRVRPVTFELNDLWPTYMTCWWGWLQVMFEVNVTCRSNLDE